MSGPRNSMEALIRSAWCAAVGQAPASIDEDFFDAGYGSIEATVLVGEIRKGLGRSIPLRIIFESPTIAGMANQIRNLDDQWREQYVYRLSVGTEEGIPAVLAPGTSGTLGWISALADRRLGRPVIGLVSRGSYAESPALRTMPEIADHLLQALSDAAVSGPIHLVGSCVGGLASVEMSSQAAGHDLEVVSVTLLNGSFAPDVMTRTERLQYRLNDIRRMSGLGPVASDAEGPDEEQIAALFEEIAGTPCVVEPTFDEFAARIMVYVNNWHAAAQYVPTKVNAPLTLLYTTGQEEEVGLEQWRSIAELGFASYAIDGLRASDVGRADVIDIIAARLADLDRNLAHAR